MARLGRDADLLLAEATYPGAVPPRSQAFLSSAAVYDGPVSVAAPGLSLELS